MTIIKKNNIKNKPERKMDKRTVLKTIENLKEGDIFVDEDGYKCHIITNLKEERQIVFKYYGKRKQWWHYFVQSYFWFELRMRDKPSIKIKIKK
jgi:hypothetical protein